MKNRIGIVIILLIGILISCFFLAGCTPLPGFITIDPTVGVDGTDSLYV